MNIFALDHNPIKAARWCVDRHTVSQVKEAAQLLATCFTKKRLSKKDCPRTAKGKIRAHSHFNHPCSKWVRVSRANMLWLAVHALELDRERMARFKPKPNYSIKFIRWVLNNLNCSEVPEGEMTPFAQAMPKEFQGKDAIKAYRKYYRYGKKHLHSWKRNKPHWIK